MKENINKTVNLRFNALSMKEKTMKNIFEIMFSSPDYIIAENTDGFKINSYTYGEVKNKIYNVSYSLTKFASENKIETGSFVGLVMDNKVEWIISFWAILMSGFKPFLVNTRLPKKMITKMLFDISAKFVLTDMEEGYDILKVKYESLKDVCKNNYEGLWANELCLSTTATTLNPKICIYTGSEISAQILNAKYILSINKNIKEHYEGRLKQLAFLPFYHIFGLSAVFLWFCFFGRTLVFLKDLSPDTILRTIRKHKVTHIFAVPVFWHSIYDGVIKKVSCKDEKTKNKFKKGLKLTNFLQSNFGKVGEYLSKKIFKIIRTNLFGESVKFCISGGSYIKNDALKLINEIGYPLYNGYGMSEVGITSVELGGYKQRIKNSVGKPFPSVEYKLNNANKTLLIKGETLYNGIIENGKYYSKNNSYFDTKDIVKIEYLNKAKTKISGYYILGRMSDLVITANGENVNPDIIEQYINLKYVKNFSVLGLGDEGYEKLCLVVQPVPYLNYNKLSILYNEIINQIKNIPFNIDKVYYTFDSIMNENAIKVSRNNLKNLIKTNAVKLLDFSEIKVEEIIEDNDVSNELVDGIIDSFSSVLKIDKSLINKNSNFSLDLGGTSLDYFSLINYINQKFSVNLNLVDGESPLTPIDLAKKVMEAI